MLGIGGIRSGNQTGPLRFITHSFRAASIAVKHGWMPGARYTNLRDTRRFERLGFLDIAWNEYSFKQHLKAARLTSPLITVARDVDDINELNRTLDEAYELLRYCDKVVVVPKDPQFAGRIDELIPSVFMLGYSVPTRYGATCLPLGAFTRSVHLLGGRPDVQRKLARRLRVASFDCNRFTLDAAFGDYFDGEKFRPHPTGGYDTCLEASVANINRLWAGYA